jgi:hypothetical protein
MSQYLDKTTDASYVSVGITLTDQLIIRASSIIDGCCKRKIAVESYTERVPLTESQRGHLSYYPVVELTALKGRPKYYFTGINFFGPPVFEVISDHSILDVDVNIGSLWCGYNMFGAPYTELEVTYTSGWAVIPDNVKVACGMIIDQLVNSNNSNVKAKKDFDSSIEYFGNKLITPEIADLLSQYVLLSFR